MHNFFQGCDIYGYDFYESYFLQKIILCDNCFESAQVIQCYVLLCALKREQQ